MDVLVDMIRSGMGGAATPGIESALLSLLLAYVLGQLGAWLYIYTHSGLSYSRAFVQSIILLTIIVALAMMVIGSNIVIAFGLIGALAVIRFRNILKDTRDTAFIFFALIGGMACGTGKYGLGILGTLFFGAVLLYLHWTAFGSRQIGDGFLRFQVAPGVHPRETLEEIFRRYCHTTQLVSQRYQTATGGEMAFRLTLRDPIHADEMVDLLQKIGGVSNVTFVLQEDQSEV